MNERIRLLAEQAGISVRGHYDETGSTPMELQKFAALVAAQEREKVAAWMMARGYATGHGDTIEDLLHELEWQIREQEREACAELAIKISQQDLPEETPEGDELRIACERIAIGVFIAETIKARGEQ